MNSFLTFFYLRGESGELVEHVTLQPAGDMVQGAQTSHTVVIKQDIQTGSINLQVRYG